MNEQIEGSLCRKHRCCGRMRLEKYAMVDGGLWALLYGCSGCGCCVRVYSDKNPEFVGVE